MREWFVEWSAERDGPVACDGVKSLWEKNDEKDGHGCAGDEEEPENRVVAHGLCENATKDWSDGLSEHAATYKFAHITTSCGRREDI